MLTCSFYPLHAELLYRLWALMQAQVEMKRLGIPRETPCAVQQWCEAAMGSTCAAANCVGTGAPCPTLEHVPIRGPRLGCTPRPCLCMM